MIARDATPNANLRDVSTQRTGALDDTILRRCCSNAGANSGSSMWFTALGEVMLASAALHGRASELLMLPLSGASMRITEAASTTTVGDHNNSYAAEVHRTSWQRCVCAWRPSRTQQRVMQIASFVSASAVVLDRCHQRLHCSWTYGDWPLHRIQQAGWHGDLRIQPVPIVGGVNVLVNINTAM